MPNTGGGGGAGIDISNKAPNNYYETDGNFPETDTGQGGKGGSGIVIFRYKINADNQVNVSIYGNLNVFGTLTANSLENTGTGATAVGLVQVH